MTPTQKWFSHPCENQKTVPFAKDSSSLSTSFVVWTNTTLELELQQNPVLVFSITLTQKKVRPPVWIILVLHDELASVRVLLVKEGGR